MGCFIACFGSSKHRKHINTPNPQIHEHFDPAAKSITKPISESIDESEKQSNRSIENKVQLDPHANTSKEEVQKYPIDEKEKEGEKEENVNQRVTKNFQENGEKNREKEENQTLSDSSMMISYPPMHRYHNYTITDDDDDDEFEESLESLFSLSIESGSLFSLSIESRKQVNIIGTEEKDEVSSPFTIPKPIGIEISSIGLNPNRDIHSVLNPVENLNQWKAVKSRTNPPTLNHHTHEEKENINLEFCEEPHNSKRNFSNLRPKLQGIEVDTSLSTWLVESEKTPMSSEDSVESRKGYSCKSIEERPILGASVEEIMRLSVCSTPRRKSPCSSCKDKSGTPTKFIEDKRVKKCNSTPFATRLERTLDIEIA